MSNLKEILVIEPPTGLSYNPKETKKGKPVNCPICFCRGGWHYDQHDEKYYTIGEFEECKLCKGSKRVWPKITIEWVADVPENNEKDKML